ncbi:hypothetical protein [Pseudonocardia sp. TRM90224]|uniref:hypothetical protein n=1 Tax=Pseudonocardia sp. TRM90224 TaxID=2812678 RepID=UPI001E5F328C|nr:hypothetical protein [Pseudonocardia sp. TRM90224]
MTATRPAPARVPAASVGWRMRPLTRKVMLIVHIVSAGAWLGIDLMVGVLVFTGRLAPDPVVAGLGYQALGLFLLWPLLVAALATLVSGIVMGLGTKYGLLRHWWVVTKLAITLVLATLIVIALAPGLGAAIEHGRQLAAGVPAEQITAGVDDLIYPALVAPSALLITYLLSVIKPWGRIRRV